MEEKKGSNPNVNMKQHFQWKFSYHFMDYVTKMLHCRIAYPCESNQTSTQNKFITYLNLIEFFCCTLCVHTIFFLFNLHCLTKKCVQFIIYIFFLVFQWMQENYKTLLSAIICDNIRNMFAIDYKTTIEISLINYYY